LFNEKGDAFLLYTLFRMPAAGRASVTAQFILEGASVRRFGGVGGEKAFLNLEEWSGSDQI